MTTTLPAPAPAVGGSDARLLTIQANLLPDEVLDARLGNKARMVAGYCVVGAVVVMLGWIGLAKWQTSSAKSDLSNAQTQSTVLTNQQDKYLPLITATNQTAAIKSQLTQLMADDLNWARLYTAMHKAAPAGITVTNLQGVLITNTNTVGGTGSTTALFNNTKYPVIGTVTIVGTAKNKNAVAAYMDALGHQPGLAAPYPANVADASGSVTFQATCLITSNALGGRFTTTTGSK